MRIIWFNHAALLVRVTLNSSSIQFVRIVKLKASIQRCSNNKQMAGRSDRYMPIKEEDQIIDSPMKIRCKTVTELVLFPVQDSSPVCLLQSCVTQPIQPMSDICIVLDLEFILTRQNYFSQHYTYQTAKFIYSKPHDGNMPVHMVLLVFLLFCTI